MIRFKQNISLKSPTVSGAILDYFNLNSKNKDLFENMVRFISKQTNIVSKEVSHEAVQVSQNVIDDLKDRNLEIPSYHEYVRLFTILIELESKIDVARSRNKGYLEIPLSAYEYKGNNKTKFARSEKLSSLLYK